MIWRGRGIHKFKFGADVRELFVNIKPASVVAAYFPGTVSDFLSSGQDGMDRSTKIGPAQLLAQAFSVYAQDTWNATNRLP